MKTLRRLTGNRAFSLVRLTTAVALISGAGAMAFVAASPGGSPQPARTGDAASNMRVVNCDRGEEIARALARAEPGDTIRVTGTCVERVSIKTDRITLDGQGTATLDGGGGPTSEFDAVVTIDGASGVTMAPGCGGTAPGSLRSSPSHRTRPPSPGMASMWIFVSGPALRSLALTLALLRVIRRS